MLTALAIDWDTILLFINNMRAFLIFIESRVETSTKAYFYLNLALTSFVARNEYEIPKTLYTL